jgi:cell division protein FtsL
MSRISSEAYDFSLFEENTSVQETAHWDNTQPKRETQGEERKSSRENVVELPKRELEKNARPKRHPLRMLGTVLCFGIIFATVITVVYNQVQLTELSDQISTTTKQLEEAESLEIQLNMEAAQQMDGAAVEQYAQEELGMSKVSGSQVTYVDVAQEDQGTVVREASGGSWLDQLWSAIQSLFQ